jgi:hypothetical protein
MVAVGSTDMLVPVYRLHDTQPTKFQRATFRRSRCLLMLNAKGTAVSSCGLSGACVSSQEWWMLNWEAKWSPVTQTHESDAVLRDYMLRNAFIVKQGMINVLWMQELGQICRNQSHCFSGWSHCPRNSELPRLLSLVSSDSVCADKRNHPHTLPSSPALCIFTPSYMPTAGEFLACISVSH